MEKEEDSLMDSPDNLVFAANYHTSIEILMMKVGNPLSSSSGLSAHAKMVMINKIHINIMKPLTYVCLIYT